MKLESRPRELHPEGLAIAIVAARFNEPIVEQLIEGAMTTWQRLGGLPESIELHHVPGAFELPLACEALAATGSVRLTLASPGMQTSSHISHSAAALSVTLVPGARSAGGVNVTGRSKSPS